MIPHFPASPFLRRMLMPIWKYLRGLIGFAVGAGSRPTYILGHPYSHGVWFYFPALTLLKSPLAFLLLLALAIAIALVVRTRGGKQFSAIPAGMELHWRCLWVSLVIFTAACMLNRLDISIRHFSIPLAVMILLLAPLPQCWNICSEKIGEQPGLRFGLRWRWLESRCSPQFVPSKLFFIYQLAQHGSSWVCSGKRFEP